MIQFITHVVMKTPRNTERAFLLRQNRNGCTRSAPSTAEFLQNLSGFIRMNASLFLQLELFLLIRSFGHFLNLKFEKKTKPSALCYPKRSFGLISLLVSLWIPGPPVSSLKAWHLSLKTARDRNSRCQDWWWQELQCQCWHCLPDPVGLHSILSLFPPPPPMFSQVSITAQQCILQSSS